MVKITISVLLPDTKSTIMTPFMISCQLELHSIPLSKTPTNMSDTKYLHRAIRRLAKWAIWSFFTELHIIGSENVPRNGPIIVAATHHNMMLDPAVLSVAFPYKRILHYWSKASLFANPVLSYVLYSTGNIPVDRKSKDRHSLFKGTFEALANGLAVALFPEGTSYTEPHIMQVKDGAAWAALEYTKWIKDNHIATDSNLKIVPVAIVYTNKSKYRSNVIVEFGTPITLDPFLERFHSGKEGDARAAVKQLTATIETALVQATINAPDWETLYAARMARDLLWEGDTAIDLDDFVVVSQTLVDLFSTLDATPNFASVKRQLLEYYSLLQTTNLTDSALSSLPLPRTLDPSHPIPIPSRLLTLSLLIRDSVSVLVHLPFFLFPLIVHAPVYIMGRLGARLVEDEEETQAQNKVVCGLLLLLMIYPAAFFFLWALFMYTRTGALLAAATVYMFALYHNKMINENYERAKRLVAAWRVLFGVWTPRRWDLSMAALSPYTKPLIPKENPWIDRPKPKTEKKKEVAQASIPSHRAMPEIPEPPVQTQPWRRPPSRRIMRHVLRARVEAVRALGGFFEQLERECDDGRKVKNLRASIHLAKAYGGSVDADDARKDEEVDLEGELQGWRSAEEVLRFLRSRGAKIPSESLQASEWAAMSEGEGSPADDSDVGGEKDEPQWVPSSG